MKPPTTLPIEEITHRQFNHYEHTLQTGMFNMIAESVAAAEFAELDRDTYFSIVKHYTALKEKFGRLDP